MLLAGCTTRQGEPDALAFIASSDLHDAYQQGSEALHLARTPLAFEQGKTATNCQAYIALRSTAAVAESVNNAAIKSEYLVCDALHLLAQRKREQALPYRPAAGLGQALASRLDLGTFPSALFNRTDERAYTLATLFPPQAITVGGAEVSAETEHEVFRMAVAAVADVDNNGQPDWIVWISSESKDGNERAYQTVVVPNVAGQGEGRWVGSSVVP